MRGLCQSLPEKLHVGTATIVGPAGIAAQLADQADAAPRQTDIVEGPLHDPRHVEALAAVLDLNGQASALALRRHLQVYAHIAVLQRIEARIALFIVTRKPLGIALEAGVEPQHPVFQGIEYNSASTLYSAPLCARRP